MSKYNEYARRLNKLAKDNFEKYTKAKEEYDDASELMARYPMRFGNVDHEYENKRMRATVAYNEAKEAFKAVQREYADTLKEVKQIRTELAADIEKDYIVDPEQLDSATVELMKSGILKPADYVKIMHDARESGNHTMIRMIAKYAEDASKALETSGLDNKALYEGRERLSAVINAGKTDDGREYLETFDYIADVYQRSVNNPAMIGYWDNLTENAIENL